MNKYSIQNECLESIEAFSDEEMASELAVIEAAIDIFEKSILMMELSNSDIDLPNCPLFMESFLIQEGGGNGAAAETANNGATTDSSQSTSGADNAQNNAQTNNNGNTQATDNKAAEKPMTDEERKAYNKEHWVRMKNKKGNTENILVSILAFIPRLLGFIIQAGVRLVKKLTNKDTDQKAEAISKAPQDAKDKAAKDVGNVVDAAASNPTQNTGSDNNNATSTNNNNNNNNGQPAAQNEGQTPTAGSNAGAVNVQQATAKWYDDSVINAINGLTSFIQSLNVEYDANDVTPEQVPKYVKMFVDLAGQAQNEFPKAKQAFEQAINKPMVDMPLNAVQNSKNNITNAFNQMQEAADGVNKKFSTISTNIVNKVIRVPVLDENGQQKKDAQGRGIYTDTAENREKNTNNLNNAIKPLKDIALTLKSFAQTVAKEGTANLANSYANYAKNIDTAYNAISKYYNTWSNNGNNNGNGNANNNTNDNNGGGVNNGQGQTPANNNGQQ